jgi:hypothetical protein
MSEGDDDEYDDITKNTPYYTKMHKIIDTDYYRSHPQYVNDKTMQDYELAIKNDTTILPTGVATPEAVRKFNEQVEMEEALLIEELNERYNTKGDVKTTIKPNGWYRDYYMYHIEKGKKLMREAMIRYSRNKRIRLGAVPLMETDETVVNFLYSSILDLEECQRRIKEYEDMLASCHD